MNNKRATKRALLTSVTALVMCVVMLVGTTFAWFTDTASTGVNKIQAGNLDIDIVGEDGNSLDGKTLSFKNVNNKTDILWEPGATFFTQGFQIVNKGNLALKYKVVVSGTTGDAKLLEAIDFAVVTDNTKTDADAVSFAEEGKLLNKGDTAPESAATDTGAKAYYYLRGHMKEEAGNEYKNLTMDGISITVYATQYTHENDSFGPDYDKYATYYPVLDAAGMKDALVNGGNIKMDANVDPSEALVATKDTTIDMNGKTIANTNGVWDVVPNSWSLLSAQGENVKLTITGNGTFQAKENDCYAVDVQDGATVTIENGTFIGNIHAVYVLKGTAYIKGGFYSVQQKYPDAAKADEFVLNCYDANRANGTAKIIVTGGTFVNFNPANCQAEGPNTDFVADGYSVISETKANGDVWYTVVKGTGATVGTQEDLNSAISDNTTSTVKLTTAGTYELPNLDSRDVTIIGTKDTVINMKNEVRKASSVSFEGVTVEFANATYKGFQHTGKLTYKDCTIIGQQFLYATEVEFINCTFEQNSSDAYNVWTYGAGSVLFKDCTFNCAGKAVLVYNEGYVAGQTVEFQNCKFNASAPVAGKAAIEIDCTFTSYNVVIDKATADGVTNFANGSVSGSPVWNVKKGSNPTTVTLDGTQVYPTV